MRWILTTWQPAAPDSADEPLRYPLLPEGAPVVTFWPSQGDRHRVLALLDSDTVDLSGLDAQDLTGVLADAHQRELLGPEFGLAPGWDPASFADHPH